MGTQTQSVFCCYQITSQSTPQKYITSVCQLIFLFITITMWYALLLLVFVNICPSGGVNYEEKSSGLCSRSLSPTECADVHRSDFADLTYVASGGPPITGCVLVDGYVFHGTSKSTLKCGDAGIRCFCKID